MNNVVFQDALEKFISYLKEQKRASATILAYKADIAQLIKFLEDKGLTSPGGVTTELLEEFKADLENNGYIAKSVSRKINSIKTFFKFLKTEGFSQADPAAPVSHPKYEIKPPRILSRLEYRALRDACRGDARISAIVEIMLQTGVRIAEAAGLSLDDIKENDIHITAYESHGERDIPLNKAAKEALNRYLAERPQVKEKSLFVTKTGRPFLVRNIRSSIEKYFELAGIKNATVNDLRHTWIFHHLAAGTPLVVISKLAGHKRLSTTEKYLKLITEKKEGSVKLDEL